MKSWDDRSDYFWPVSVLARNINVPGQLDSCDASQLGMLNELKQARHLDVYLYCLGYENGCHKYRSLRKSGKRQISTETSTDATCIHTNIGNTWHCLTRSVNCKEFRMTFFSLVMAPLCLRIVLPAICTLFCFHHMCVFMSLLCAALYLELALLGMYCPCINVYGSLWESTARYDVLYNAHNIWGFWLVAWPYISTSKVRTEVFKIKASRWPAAVYSNHAEVESFG